MSLKLLQGRIDRIRMKVTHFHSSKRMLLLGFLLVAFMSAVTFLVKSSRPTADEYLLAPLLHGFYIDAGTPDQLLFRPENNVFFNFFSAVFAAFRLGWDSPLNFAFFQMIPATLLNFIGKSSTSILCVVYFSIAFLAVKSSIAINFSGKREKITVNLMILLGLMLSIVITDFGSEKEYFGIYSLTGIRFGLYWLQPLLAFCAFMYLLRTGDEKRSNFGKKLLLFFLVPAFCSLWTSVFWIILISLYLLLSLVETKQSGNALEFRIITKQVRGLAISVVTTLIGMFYILKPTVNAGRFIGEKGQILDRIEQNGSNFLDGFLRIIPFWNVSFWQVTFSSPVIVGFIIGIMVSRLRIIQVSRNFSVRFSRGKKFSFPLASSVLLATMLIYNFTFHFMEFFTYPAWWHRSSPSAIGYFGGLVLGVEIGPKLLKHFRRAGFLAILSISLFATYKIPYVVASMRSLEAFAVNWDRGDLLGNGSPVQNNAEYICVEIAQISPKKLECLPGDS